MRRPTNSFTRRRPKPVSASFRLAVEALESRTVLSATHLLAQAMFSEPFPGEAPRVSYHADPAPGPVRLGAPPLQDSPRGTSDGDGRHGPGDPLGLALPALAPGPPATARGSDLTSPPPARPWETDPAPLEDLRPRGNGPARPPLLAELESLTTEESALQLSAQRTADEWNGLELTSPPFSAWQASWEDSRSTPSLTPRESPHSSADDLAAPTSPDAFSEADWDIYQDSDDEGGVVELGDLGSALRRSLLPPALQRDTTAAETSAESEDDEWSEWRQPHASPRDEAFDESRLQDLLDPQLDEDRYDQGRSTAGETHVPGDCARAGGHEEGGTIELAVAAYSTAAWSPTDVSLADERALRASPSCGGGVDSIPMDTGLGLFQAFELAVGPGESGGRPAAVPVEQREPAAAPVDASAEAATLGDALLDVPANRALAVPVLLAVVSWLDGTNRKRTANRFGA